MQGYWPSPADETIEQKLKNLQGAINLRDDNYVFVTLGTDKDNLLSSRDSNNETLLMFARRNGCSERMRKFLESQALVQSTAKADEYTPNSTSTLKY